ncbi:hypothetical protein [Microbacterium sp. NPDC090003]|uniref:hypothetical protein n=1 Tax=Microbacterium sp. NPDC090003 TaxID=3364203 RepID=UPI00381CDECD
MNPQPANRTAVIAAVLVGVGALLSSLAGYLFVLGGVPNVPRVWILPDPIGWGFGRGGSPLPVLGMLLALVVLSGLTWLFVRLIVRGALPGRGAAVFFGTWGAVMIASAAAGLVRAPADASAAAVPAAVPGHSPAPRPASSADSGLRHRPSPISDASPPR